MESSSIKRLSLALAISAGLNCFFIGYGITMRHKLHGMRDGPMAHGLELGPHGLLQRVGLADVGPEIEQLVKGQRAALRAQRDAVVAARAHVTDALEAEPFDTQRFSGALAELRTQSAQMQAQMHSAFVQVAQKLTLEQRKHVARSPWFLRAPAGR